MPATVESRAVHIALSRLDRSERRPRFRLICCTRSPAGWLGPWLALARLWGIRRVRLAGVQREGFHMNTIKYADAAGKVKLVRVGQGHQLWQRPRPPTMAEADALMLKRGFRRAGLRWRRPG